MEFYKQAIRYLKSCRIKASGLFVRERMQSHPDYPSLVALTDTLDELGVPYTASLCDKNMYQELKYPLMGHTLDKGRNDFIQVNTPAVFRENKNGILEKWDGVSLYISPDSVIKNADHNTQLFKEKAQASYEAAGFVLAASLLLILTGIHTGWLLVSLQLLSITGAFICGLIVLHGLGKDNAITEQLCPADGGHGCDTVLQSKAAAWKGIGLGEIGLVYFTSFSIYLALSTILATVAIAGVSLLIIPVATGVLVAIASFLYQWLIAKAWCRMCLLVDFVLCLQAVILYGALAPDFSIALSADHILLFVFSLLFPAIVWMLYKRVLLQYDATETDRIKAVRFKRVPEIFQALLSQQRRVDTTPWPDDIISGNPQAALQLMVACNPYCGPCAKAHKEIEGLLSSYPDEIGITIRFTIKADQMTDKKTIAVGHIITAWQEGHASAIDDWFDLMDITAYQAKLPVNPENVSLSGILHKHEQWAAEVKITHTPTTFMNGYEWPKQYKLTDLKTILMPLIENITTSTVVANTEGVV